MPNNLSELLDESIALELNVSEVYLFYHRTFPEDGNFWWQLFLEEKNHASLLRSVKEIFLPLGIVPEQVVKSHIDTLTKSNRKIAELLESYQKKTPSMEEAYRTAVELEETTGELHYQTLMTEIHDAKLIKILKKLNGDDKDHATRIRKLLETKTLQRI